MRAPLAVATRRGRNPVERPECCGDRMRANAAPWSRPAQPTDACRFGPLELRDASVLSLRARAPRHAHAGCATVGSRSGRPRQAWLRGAGRPRELIVQRRGGRSPVPASDRSGRHGAHRCCTSRGLTPRDLACRARSRLVIEPSDRAHARARHPPALGRCDPREAR